MIEPTHVVAYAGLTDLHARVEAPRPAIVWMLESPNS